MSALNTKVNTDYIVSSCWGLTVYLFLEKVLTLVLSFFLIENQCQTSPASDNVTDITCRDNMWSFD